MDLQILSERMVLDEWCCVEEVMVGGWLIGDTDGLGLHAAKVLDGGLEAPAFYVLSKLAVRYIELLEKVPRRSVELTWTVRGWEVRCVSQYPLFVIFSSGRFLFRYEVLFIESKHLMVHQRHGALVSG